MEDFNLEWFVSNVSNKIIQVEFSNDEGNLISLVNLSVNDAKINHQKYFNILTINDNLQIYFDDFEINNLDNCLCFYHGEKILISIYLQNDEIWESEKNEVNNFVQY